MTAPRLRPEGTAGDADYGRIGRDYTMYRQPEPAIISVIADALAGARTVVNVGAGAGSYGPIDRTVTAVEPSPSMRSQRPAHLSPAIDAVAESLPFPDNSFDAALATFTVHQWTDLTAGIAELRRVTTGPICVLTCDPAALDRFWLNEYAPEVIAVEAGRYPTMPTLTGLLGDVEVVGVPIPLLCADGFGEAYYGRPEIFLDPGARLANSAWSFVGPEVASRFEQDLRRDLDSGAWDARYGHLRRQPTFDGALRLVVGRPAQR